jgi:hypothetical protein
LLAQLDRESEAHTAMIHLVCDHGSTPHGPEGRTWLATQPRVIGHFTPVHGSWRNPVEPGCSILQRKRLKIADFASKDQLKAQREPFSEAWHQQAHPFHGSTRSVAKVMAEAPAMAA